MVLMLRCGDAWLRVSLRLLPLLLLCLPSAAGAASVASDCAPADASASATTGWLLRAPWSEAIHTSRPHAHPPAAAAATLSPGDLYALVAPRFPPPPLSPLLLGLLSALAFALLYLASFALHEYLVDDLEHALLMHEAEERMRAMEGAAASGQPRRDSADNGPDRRDSPRVSHTNGLHHRRVAPMPVTIIPAATVAPASAPRSLLASYLYAYASGGRRSLTAKIEWNSRLVSNVHALCSVVLGVVCLVRTDARVDSGVLRGLPGAGGHLLPSESLSGASLLHPWSRHFTPSLLAFNEDPLRDASLMLTCGYLLYDLALCLWVRFGKFQGVRDPFWKKPDVTATATTTRGGEKAAQQQQQQRQSHPPPVHLADGLTLTHHVLIIFAFSLGVHVHVGTFFMACFLLNEASTPALNLNFFLATARAAGMWGAAPATAAATAAAGEPTKGGAAVRGCRVAWLYKANGAALFVLFLLMRVIFNVLVLLTMASTWARLPSLWLGSSAPFVMTPPAALPPAVFVECALLTALAAGHVTINLAWFAALTRAVRRKMGDGGAVAGSAGAKVAHNE